MRIAKFIASSGICSRRDAERFIEAGRVKLNGTPVTSPAVNIGDGDKIELDGKPLKPQNLRIFSYYKPAGLVVSHKDEKGRESVFDKLPSGLLSVGRLDLMSEGLLLLTTSGDMQRMLEKGTFERVYRVRVRGLPTLKDLAPATRGMTIDGVNYKPAKLEIETQTTFNTWLRITLTEGKNHEIRNIMKSLGFPVLRLIRTSYAGIELGPLKPGELREEANVPTAP